MARTGANRASVISSPYSGGTCGSLNEMFFYGDKCQLVVKPVTLQPSSPGL